LFVAGLAVRLQEFNPQQPDDQFGQLLEMQPVPGLDVDGL